MEKAFIYAVNKDRKKRMLCKLAGYLVRSAGVLTEPESRSEQTLNDSYPETQLDKLTGKTAEGVGNLKKLRI